MFGETNTGLHGVFGGDVIFKPDVLIGLLQDSTLSARSQQPLLVSLAAAVAAFDRGNVPAGANQLQAFQNKLRAQIMPFNAALANEFIRAAQNVIDRTDTRVPP